MGGSLKKSACGKGTNERSGRSKKKTEEIKENTTGEWGNLRGSCRTQSYCTCKSGSQALMGGGERSLRGVNRTKLPQTNERGDEGL